MLIPAYQKILTMLKCTNLVFFFFVFQIGILVTSGRFYQTDTRHK